MSSLFSEIHCFNVMLPPLPLDEPYDGAGTFAVVNCGFSKDAVRGFSKDAVRGFTGFGGGVGSAFDDVEGVM